MFKVLFNQPVKLTMEGLESEAMFTYCSKIERMPNKAVMIIQGNLVPLSCIASVELDKDFN